MSGVNRVIIVGNVGKDPEIRTLNNGDRIANMSVGVTEKWKAQDGERKERTEWVRVVCFNDNITKVIESYVKKGSQVYLEGQMQTRKYEQNGVEKYTTEVVITRFRGELVLLGSRDSGGGGGREEPEPSRPARQAKDAYDLSDDIPFLSR